MGFKSCGSQFSNAKHSISEVLLNNYPALQFLETELLASKNMENILYSQIIAMLQSVCDQAKKNKNSRKRSQYIAILILNSLILNIYVQTNNSNAFDLNNSLAASQSSFFSVNQTSLIHEASQIQPIVHVVQRLSQEEDVFKKLHQIIQLNKFNHDINRRTLHGFIETIDYILSRQKIQKTLFYTNKKSLTTLVDFTKPLHTMHVQKVNEVIFSGKLNMIESFLQDNSQRIGFSLIRVYYAATNLEAQSSNTRCFNNISHGGDVMIYNLYKLYVCQFSRKLQLFINTKSALYEFIITSLYVQFLPVIKNFSLIFKKMVQKTKENYDQFYSICESLIKQELLNFIEQLPPALLYKLNLLRVIIKNHDKWKDPHINCLSPVKMLFLNRFLFSSIFMQFFYSHEIVETAESVANHLNDLFFFQAAKKYPKNETAQRLIEEISQAFQNAITYNFQLFQGENRMFFVDELILKHDYQQLYDGLQRAKFSPKDETQFLMASIQKDIITSRARKVYEQKLSHSMNVSERQVISSVIKQKNILSSTSDFSEFVSCMQSGQSKFSQFLRKKQQRLLQKQPAKNFATFSQNKFCQFKQLSNKYKLSKI